MASAASRPMRPDSAARVRSRATLIESVDRCPILRVSRRWSKKEELIERQLTLKDVALSEPGDPLDVGRLQHLPGMMAL